MQITQYFKCHRGYQKKDMRRNINKLLHRQHSIQHQKFLKFMYHEKDSYSEQIKICSLGYTIYYMLLFLTYMYIESVDVM